MYPVTFHETYLIKIGFSTVKSSKWKHTLCSGGTDISGSDVDGDTVEMRIRRRGILPECTRITFTLSLLLFQLWGLKRRSAFSKEGGFKRRREGGGGGDRNKKKPVKQRETERRE